MIEIWMTNHLVSDNTCNIVNLICPQKIYKERQILLGEHLVFVTLHRSFQLVLSKTTIIGDTEYDI